MDENDVKAGFRMAFGRVAKEYEAEVRRLGRERQEVQGGAFSLGDFIAGASVVCGFMDDDDRLVWPATAWALQLFGGRNPLWPAGDEPARGNGFLEQWVVIDTREAQRRGAMAEAVASFDDRFEAAEAASKLNEASGYFSRYMVVQVPWRGYADRANYPLLAEMEEEE